MRIELERFVEEMERILKENDYKGGWKKTDNDFLIKKLIEEFAEYFVVLENPTWTGLNVIREFVNQFNYASGHYPNDKKVQRKELVDIANICMMLHDNTDKI